ncbi:hypothetical protein L1267_18885 [Pseudoalteromonas sp. OFAV1]|uniref:hypothetical protein n=1 Tax=Pseudoalteromonas sp. OFAV1 TaxID=2908892 RepID=UPI001F472C53|nr:hypothetical protein [Pseudoalteromonas sp. OFAV1]MCF2902439.1 hypothetical protein [Pseudoalteromonas sp. OFAV1]
MSSLLYFNVHSVQLSASEIANFILNDLYLINETPVSEDNFEKSINALVTGLQPTITGSSSNYKGKTNFQAGAPFLASIHEFINLDRKYPVNGLIPELQGMSFSTLRNKVKRDIGHSSKIKIQLLSNFSTDQSKEHSFHQITDGLKDIT